MVSVVPAVVPALHADRRWGFLSAWLLSFGAGCSRCTLVLSARCGLPSLGTPWAAAPADCPAFDPESWTRPALGRRSPIGSPNGSPNGSSLAWFGTRSADRVDCRSFRPTRSDGTLQVECVSALQILAIPMMKRRKKNYMIPARHNRTSVQGSCTHREAVRPCGACMVPCMVPCIC